VARKINLSFDKVSPGTQKGHILEMDFLSDSKIAEERLNKR
jgi:hypothetical protein